MRMILGDNRNERISFPVVFFSLYVALMLFQPERIGKLSAFVGLTLTILSCIITKRVNYRSFKIPRQSLYLILFCILLTVVTFSLGGSNSDYLKFISQALLYVVLAALPTNDRENEFIKSTFVYSSTIYAVLAIYYCFTAGNSRYFHEDVMIFGASIDPNYLGVPFVITLTIILNKILTGKRVIIYTFLYFIVAVAVVLTASRGNMLAWIVTTVLTVYFFVKDKKTVIGNRGLWLFLITCIAILFVYYISRNYVNQWTRMINIGVDTDNGRLVLWKRAIQLWLHSPIIGNGLKSMTRLYGRAAHNTYLQILTDTGVIGGVLILAFLKKHLFGILKKDKVLFAALIGVVIQMFFLNMLDNRVVWIFFSWIAMRSRNER